MKHAESNAAFLSEKRRTRITTRVERLKRMLMMCGAFILFVLGVWLLVKPVQARGAEFRAGSQGQSLVAPALGDNVIADGCCIAAPGSGAAHSRTAAI